MKGAHARRTGPDYTQYCFSAKEWIIMTAACIGLAGLAGFLFYDALWLSAAGVLLVWPVSSWQKRERIRMRQKQMGFWFKEAMVKVYALLAAGSNMESAFLRTAKELHPDSLIGYEMVREFREIRRKLGMNIRLEECLKDLAERSDQEDIRDFYQVIVIAGKSGGSLTQIVRDTIASIQARMTTEAEIATVMAGKRGEFLVMVMVPAGILLYMRLCSPGFLDILYTDFAGRFLMSVCLAVYLLAAAWGRHLLKIRI